MYNFESLTNSNRDEMLSSIGINCVDELFDCIPKEAKNISFDLNDGISEMKAEKELLKLSLLNKTNYLSFLGGGARKRYIPAVIDNIVSRVEFLTCYTPYEAELSQGSLEAMYEFQSIICNLVRQDVSNASHYDVATAMAEAILMASRITRNKKVYISKNINPNYLKVIKTYLWASDIEITDNYDDMELCAKLYQSPNYYGEFEPKPQKNDNELIIAGVDLFSLAISEPPDADITVGDVQSLGVGLKFGGSYAGFIAVKDEYKRQLSGRIVGKTVDKDGKIAYCLTLQAREQHIRRQKATSNICSNQAQIALISNIYLRKLGKSGFIELSQKSYMNAHYLSEHLEKSGYKIFNSDFYDEFCIENIEADKFLSFMKENNILAGLKISADKVLVSVSEIFDKEELDEYIKLASEFVK